METQAKIEPAQEGELLRQDWAASRRCPQPVAPAQSHSHCIMRTSRQMPSHRSRYSRRIAEAPLVQQMPHNSHASYFGC